MANDWSAASQTNRDRCYMELWRRTASFSEGGRMGTKLRAGLLALLLFATPHGVRAQALHSPAPGSSERRAILDAVRPVVVAQVGPPVEFVVNDIRVVGLFAFVVVEPQRPGGGSIDYSHLDDGLMDGLRTEAILVNRNGRWLVAHHGTGATDVWYLGFCGDYPRGLIPGC